jgi:radical SAM protein with 4Fe4S-binding SPASM domain
MRIHLRIDPDGDGTLLINASRILHLNPTAALMAKSFLEGQPDDQVARELAGRFSVSKQQARHDYANFQRDFENLLEPDSACPVHDLELDTLSPFSRRPSAPYRMDLALTYRCNNDCSHCYNARPRSYPELSTQDWQKIIDRVWQLGIPHVVFTGGEPTLRHDLPELVNYAQNTGLVTGLNTNARRLSDRSYLVELVGAGLDHVQVTLESHQPELHDRMVKAHGAWQQTVRGLENALDSPLFVMTNTTMLQGNAPFLEGTLEFLAEMGVPTIGLNALIYAGAGATCGDGLSEQELTPLLQIARNITDSHNQRLIWYTPTQYCRFDPMELDLGVKGCTAALYNMCIEPDGMVIPCQSYYQPLGSLLHDPWETIWDHDLATGLRDRRFAAEKCRACLLLAECGGGCPLSAS